MLKGEAHGKIISEFVGLRTISYAFVMDGDEFKKCKGVKKYVVNKEIRLNDYKKMFIFRKTTAETNECDSESSSRSYYRASQHNRFACWWWQTNNPSTSTKYISSRLSRVRTDREAQGKAEGAWERIGAWGREFLYNFGHRWEVDKINKQRKEPDPSIPSSLLLATAPLAAL